MRLFIAIELNDDLKDALTSMQAQLRARRVGGNYTKVENLHLTLAFIGEYGDPDRVLDVMRSVPFAPLPIALEGFGCFGDLYWCGLARQDALTAYVGRLRRALAEADIPFDRKRFSPHITLLRRASADRLPGITVPHASMTADRVSLMRSERGKNGMIYTELGKADARGPILVSKCLAGFPCRYDGKDNLVPELRALVERGEAVAVCPEVLGGLPTPRTPSEIQPDGRVLNKRGEDVTAQFVGGAERALAICRENGCTGAVLKARSPSCGKGVIYDGSFTGARVPGSGVFAQMLLDAGVPVMTEEDYAEEKAAEPFG